MSFFGGTGRKTAPAPEGSLHCRIYLLAPLADARPAGPPRQRGNRATGVPRLVGCCAYLAAQGRDRSNAHHNGLARA